MAKSWGSVRDGKWHITLATKPSFIREEESLCGLRFTPLNVTWDEAPPTHPHYICKRCEKKAAGHA